MKNGMPQWLLTAVLFSFFIFPFPFSAFAREYTQTWATDQSVVRWGDPIRWFQGESVNLTVLPTLAGETITISSNAELLWEVATQGTNPVVYLAITGALNDAGAAVFSLAPSNSILPAGSYQGFVRAMATNESGLLSDVYVHHRVTVQYSPASSDYEPVGPISIYSERDPTFTTWLDNFSSDWIITTNFLFEQIQAVGEQNLATSNALALASATLTTNLAAEATARAEADAIAANRLDEVEATRLTSVRCRGGWYNPDYFTLRLQPYPYNIISVGETQAVNSVYVSLVTVDSAAGYLLDPTVIRMSTFTGAVAFTALSNCSVEQVTVTNYSVWQTTTQDYFAVIYDAIAGEYAGISAELNGYTRQTSVVYAVSNELSYYSYKGDVPGSLRAYVNTSLAARAAASNRTMNLFEDGWPSYGSGGTWIRNTNCWAYGIDLTCVSPYNTQGNQVEKGGTAITRQHVAYADHYSFTNNARLLFVDNTNGQHWRSIIDQRTVPGCDIRIGLLDAPLPETITPAQFLRGADNGRFLGVEELAGLPKLNTVNLKAVEGNDPKVFAKWACFGYAYIDKRGGIIGSGTAPLRSHDDHEYSRSVKIGDSGHPIFIIAGTNTIIHSAWESFMGGPNYGYYAPEIETMLRAMGSTPYTNLHYVNLTAWRDYNTPPTP